VRESESLANEQAQIQNSEFTVFPPPFALALAHENKPTTQNIIMAKEITFLPRQKAEVARYGARLHEVISADDYDPALLDLTSADVTGLGEAVAANQAVLDEIGALKLKLQAKFKELNGPKGTHRKLVVKLRKIGTKARASSAPADALKEIGMKRKAPKRAVCPAPTDSPEFNFTGAIHGLIGVRFREKGSARPRARAENTIGVQIAAVDASNPKKDGEANRAPSQIVTSSPAQLNSTEMPPKVRLYARWITRRGLTGPWSGPLPVAVS
jgi:hypothetical protein